MAGGINHVSHGKHQSEAHQLPDSAPLRSRESESSVGRDAAKSPVIGLELARLLSSGG